MGLFSGLGKALQGLNLQKIGQAARNYQGLMSEDEEERQRTLKAMALQRQQQPQPQGLNTAITPNQYAIPRMQQPSQAEVAEAIEMMLQGRSQGWHGGWNPPGVLSFGGNY